jgi:ribokinase
VSEAVLYAVGNLTIDDIVVWPTGQVWMGQAGGNVLYAALGAQIWWNPVRLLARRGLGYPDDAVEDIETRGIGLELISVNVPTLHNWALYEADGARQFVNHLNSGPNEAFTPRPDEIPADLEAAACHIAPMPTHQQLELVHRLARPKRLISFDLHESFIVGQEAEIYATLAQVDFFLPSRIEAERLYGTNDSEAAAKAFAEFGPKVVVIKIGAEGSLVYDAVECRLTHVAAFPADVRDTTGAGDAYCGGFLAGYLLSGEPVRAAVCGTVSASYVVETVGALATHRPTRVEAEERVAIVDARL